MAKRTEYISILSTKAEKQEIKRAARRAGLTLSTFCVAASLARARESDRTGAHVTQPESQRRLREQSDSVSSAPKNEASLNVVGQAGPSDSTLEDSHA